MTPRLAVKFRALICLIVRANGPVLTVFKRCPQAYNWSRYYCLLLIRSARRKGR